jgi:hypothetical protein
MPTSIFDTEFRHLLNSAKRSAHQAGGPFPSPQQPGPCGGAIALVRRNFPAWNFDRLSATVGFTFAPPSSDGHIFRISTSNGGVLAFSRIPNDEEIVVVANTNVTEGISVDVM